MGSQHQGKDAEREAANILEKVTGEQWQRVPQSGATATTHNTENHVFNGDVFTEGKWNDVCVEVKKMQDMKASHIYSPTKRIKSHLKQAREESDEFYILMMKINYQGWFVYFEEGVLGHTYFFELDDCFRDYSKGRTIVEIEEYLYKIRYLDL